MSRLFFSRIAAALFAFGVCSGPAGAAQELLSVDFSGLSAGFSNSYSEDGVDISSPDGRVSRDGASKGPVMADGGTDFAGTLEVKTSGLFRLDSIGLASGQFYFCEDAEFFVGCGKPYDNILVSWFLGDDVIREERFSSWSGDYATSLYQPAKSPLADRVVIRAVTPEPDGTYAGCISDPCGNFVISSLGLSLGFSSVVTAVPVPASIFLLASLVMLTLTSPYFRRFLRQ